MRTISIIYLEIAEDTIVNETLGIIHPFNYRIKDSISESSSFPQLPYWIDGNIKMSESGAILRHLARKNGLDGKTEEEKIRIDVAVGVLSDLFMTLVDIAYGPNGVSLFILSWIGLTNDYIDK